MRLKLFSGLEVEIRQPLRMYSAWRYELTFFLPINSNPPSISLPNGYRIKRFSEFDRTALLSLFKKCGFNFNARNLDDALDICLPGGVFIIEHEATGAIVSSMMARHLASREFPFGGRIDWLLTHPNHRGHKLGKVSALLATNHLIKLGYENIWVTTQPHRLNAIKIFQTIGFTPTEHTKKVYKF